jgi:hypothetical protein
MRMVSSTYAMGDCAGGIGPATRAPLSPSTPEASATNKYRDSSRSACLSWDCRRMGPLQTMLLEELDDASGRSQRIFVPACMNHSFDRRRFR